MPPLADFISRIFASGRTQGLSGGAEVVVDADPASAFYLSRLRRHSAEGDLVDDPSQLWSTNSYGGKRGGLKAHIASERGEGIASFTDVLVVVSQADVRRAAQQAGWTERVASFLSEEFTEFCVSEKFELLYGTRPLRFWITADGGKEMLAESFGLEEGEFITGLLPNLYVGPAVRSRPVLAVHMNLPGVWEGYREVARLYSDQIVLTLGRHWLDNYHHPGLKEPGLYRLQQYPDGSLVHVISPELQNRYFVRSDQTEAGPSVLTIAEASGRPVAFVVLAVIESQTVEIPAPAELEEAMLKAAAATPRGKGKAPAAEAPVAIALPPTPGPAAASSPSGPGSVGPATISGGLGGKQKTIVPDAFDNRIVTLQERGALLQKVHFSNFMEGYDVYLGPKAQVATSNAAPRAIIQVRFGRVTLVARETGVKLDSRVLDPGQPILLKGTVDIEIDGVKVSYRDLSGVKAEGWPYLGELRRPGGGAYLDFGACYQVGRDRRSKVRLPDEPHNENIAWLPSVGGGASIRSRTGDIPKSRFYTDSIMVASTHADIDLTNDPVLRSQARHCYTFIRRGDEIIALFPREGAGGRHEAPIRPNDEILVGNCLFHVGFPPASMPPAASLPPKDVPKFTASDLAAVADARPVHRALPTVDPAVPAGLGAQGPAPRPPSPPPESRPAAAPRKKPKTNTFNDSFATEANDPGPLLSAVNAALDAPDRSRPPSPVKIDPTDLVSGPHAVPPPGMRAKAGALAPAPEPPHSPERPAEKGERATKPKAADKPPPPMMLDDSELNPVYSVEEKQWQMELGRPARLVQVGWSVNGEFTMGNHRGIDMVVPEVKSFAEQAFLTLDYVRLYARGKKAIELIQEGEATVVVAGGKVRSTDNIRDAEIQIVRRDANLEPDFDISLRFTDGARLPDPRAQLLSIDVGDRLVSALFTVGFPLRTPRPVRFGPISATVRFDGEKLLISDYLSSYRTGASGFVAFFYQVGEKPWLTVPEDGAEFALLPGGGLLCGTNVYRFEVA